MENEKTVELLKGIWENLTDEQKEKVKACRSMDELTALAGEERIELPDELLNASAGGYYKKVPKSFDAWNIYDDKTDQCIGGVYGTWKDAKAMCRQLGVDDIQKSC